MTDLADLLTELWEYFDGRADVEDGNYSEPRPNKAMRFCQEIDEALEALKKRRESVTDDLTQAMEATRRAASYVNARLLAAERLAESASALADAYESHIDSEYGGTHLLRGKARVSDSVRDALAAYREASKGGA